jgi:hypothetical protein
MHPVIPGGCASIEPGIWRLWRKIPSSSLRDAPGMTPGKLQVSTSPVVAPLAAESFLPCGSAK